MMARRLTAGRGPAGGVCVQAYPVSVKGVVARDGRVLLLRNERQEWELPGGRLELGETPHECVAREIAEETGWLVTAGPIIDAWMYHIAAAGRHVFIVTYGCELNPGQGAREPVLSAEHQRVGLFTPADIAELVMPAGYRASIASWLADRR
jgi:ADP-ribose pyrophosphatase YjhB (NUDIX family)